MDIYPGRIFENNIELMKGYDVRFYNTWVYNTNQTDSIMSYNKNKYDLGQLPYSLLNDCELPIIQGNNQAEKHRWTWASTETPFWFETANNNTDTIIINQNTLILYSEINPNVKTTFFKSTNSGPSWKANPNIQIFECSNILIKDIDFQGGKDCIVIGNLGLNVPLNENDISKNIEITNCNIGKYSSDPLGIKNAENIIIRNNIFDSGYEKKIGLSETNCNAIVFRIDLNDSSARYYYSGSDRGTGDAIELLHYAKNCEIYGNEFTNWGHAAVQLNTWRYEDPHIADSNWSVSGNKIYNNVISAPDISYGRAFTVFGNETKNNEFYNNLIKNVTIQSQIAGVNNSFHHNIFDNVTQSAIRPKGYAVGIRVIPTQQDIYCNGNKFDNNTFINCEDSGIMITSENGYQPIHNNYFRNNIFYNCGKNSGDLIIQSNAPNLCTDEGISFCTNGVYNNTYLNNLFYNNWTDPNIINILYHGSSITVNDFEELDGNRQNEINNNINQDPKFINLATTYNLLNDSPCRNNGDISIILDDNGNLLNNNEFNKFDFYNTVFPNEAPDIGAVEIKPTVTKISNTDENCNKVLSSNNTRVDFYPIIGNNEGYTIKLIDSDFNYLEFFVNSTFFYLSDYYNVKLRDSQGLLTGNYIETNRWYGVKIKKGNFNTQYNYSNYGGHCNIKSPNIFSFGDKIKNLANADLNYIIYPNPCDEILNIFSHNNNEFQIKIFSIEGKKNI